jgi:predicted ATPase
MLNTLAVRGERPVQGVLRKKPISLRLGFAVDDFSYAIDLGLPPPGNEAFGYDPHIKRECVWSGPVLRPSAVLVDRRGSFVKAREEKGTWAVITQGLASFDSMMTHCADPRNTPEMLMIDTLQQQPRCHSIVLAKQFGQTVLADDGEHAAHWQWPNR